MKDFSAQALKQKCEAAGCKFTSRKAGTDYLLKLLKHYDTETCPPRGDDDIPTRHETFLEVGKSNKDYSYCVVAGAYDKPQASVNKGNDTSEDCIILDPKGQNASIIFLAYVN